MVTVPDLSCTAEVPSQADHDALNFRIAELESTVASVLARLDILEGFHEEPEPDPDPDPDPTNIFDAILAQPEGTWAQYGESWDALEASGDIDRTRDNCDATVPSILGAWNGYLMDGRYTWVWAAGGHGDACFNGILRYDLETGTPEVVVPHMALNTDVGLDKPYVADASGEQIRPRSSHQYNNMVKIGDYIYLLTGQVWHDGKQDMQTWRFNTTDPANTIERLADRPSFLGYGVSWIERPGLPPILLHESKQCTMDEATGAFDCANSATYFGNSTTPVWDEERQGAWGLDPQQSRIVFAQEVDGVWTTDPTLTVTDPRLDKSLIGNAGVCLVPTDTGAVPVILGADGMLLRVDGQTVTEIEATPSTASRVLNKWEWREDLGVCLGSFNWNEGFWAWRPDFSNWQADEPTPPAGDWPVFAGHTVAPETQQFTAWDQPIERQPEAPDYDAVCPGPWAELTYTTQADFDGSIAQINGLVSGGTPNIRIYVHPLVDANGDVQPYSGKLDFKDAQCAEAIGVPDSEGRIPLMGGNITMNNGRTGLIVRNFDFVPTRRPYVGCHSATNTCPIFMVWHNVSIDTVNSTMGSASTDVNNTYFEMRGVHSRTTDWHGIYLERAYGTVVALGNVFEGSGNSHHALKILAHVSRLEGNVFSSVGIDGQEMEPGRHGFFPLDAYACTDTIVRDNTFIFRTWNVARILHGYRGRQAWANCNKGERQPDGTWPRWDPEDPSFFDSQTWSDISTAADAFSVGYDEAKAEPWLFTHLSDGNTYIVFTAEGDGVIPAEIDSTRPVARGTQESDLRAEAVSVSQACAAEQDQTACFLANASPELVYVYQHSEPVWQSNMVASGQMPNRLPVDVPAGWTERAGLFWGQQEFIVCDAAGQNCAVVGDRQPGADARPWDALEVSNPPRLIQQN